MTKQLEALIARIKRQTESFDTVVLKEDEANVLIAALEQAQQQLATQRQYYEGVISDGNKRMAELERERDAMEAAALAMRDDMRQVREQLEAAEKRIAKLENDEVRQRLANAEHQLYMVELAKRNLKASRKAQFRKRLTAEKRTAELEAKLNTAEKLQDSAFRHGLQHGFSYGQTNDQAGFEQCVAAYSSQRK